MRLFFALFLCLDAGAHAEQSPYEVHAIVDIRAAGIDSPLDSFLHGGLGLLRFDDHHDGLQLGRLALDVSGPLTESVRGQVTLVAADGVNDNVIDITEAFLEWRPYPRSQWSWRTKIGAFYPPISLENRGIAWQSLYSLSPSAINTWIGEEVRTIGVETRLTNSGAALQRPFDISVIASIYGWNDPMGVLIFQRGWAIHDYEIPVFGTVPRPFPQGTGDADVGFAHEIDGRAGYYAGIETRLYGQHVLRALHYDNRGDPGASNSIEYAWLNRFDSFGARFELPHGVTLIGQYMEGDTAVGPSSDGRGMFIADFWSWFALASHTRGKHTFTARHDRMWIYSTRGMQYFESEQDADAWTFSYLYNRDEHWMIGMEALRIDGVLEQRELWGLPAAAVEQQVQVAIRYTF